MYQMSWLRGNYHCKRCKSWHFERWPLNRVSWFFFLVVVIKRYSSTSLLEPLILGVIVVRFYLCLIRIGSDIDVQAELDSDIYNPEYNARLEYREPVFPPSSILMLKVYTVESISKSLRCVGFAIIPIFLEVGTTKQPDIGASQVKVGASNGDDLLVQWDVYLKFMLFTSLGPEKLSPMSCMPWPMVLKTECIVFPYTDQRRLANNVCILKRKTLTCLRNREQVREAAIFSLQSNS